MVSTKASSTKDIIRSGEDSCSFCKKIQLATQITEEVKILKLSYSPLLNVRDLINSFMCTFTSYSQITEVIEYLTEYPANLQKYMKHVGEHFKKLVNQSDFEEAKEKKAGFFM